MANFDAKSTLERVERLEEILGLCYTKVGNKEKLCFGFGEMEKEV